MSLLPLLSCLFFFRQLSGQFSSAHPFTPVETRVESNCLLPLAVLLLDDANFSLGEKGLCIHSPANTETIELIEVVRQQNVTHLRSQCLFTTETNRSHRSSRKQ